MSTNLSTNPYAQELEGADPIVSLEEGHRRVAALLDGWPVHAFERTYAPGKWTTRQLLIHLAHMELIFGDRVRFALSTPNYVVSPFEQDEWLALDESVDAGSALAAYQGMRRMNLALFRSLTAAQRSHRFEHPERGTIDVEWVIAALAGHERRHLRHLQAIADLDD